MVKSRFFSFSGTLERGVKQVPLRTEQYDRPSTSLQLAVHGDSAIMIEKQELHTVSLTQWLRHLPLKR